MKYVAFACAVLLAACAGRAPLPVYGQVPPFDLADQNGAAFARSALDGKVWVADFIYTTCNGPCPLMSRKMRQVQSALAKYPDARFISFTVDPAHDTPPVLAEYAKRYHAEPGRWYFLTGTPERLNTLGRDGFKLNSVDGALTHSTRLVLVDRQSRIRGYYTSTEDDAIPRLIADARRLL